MWRFSVWLVITFFLCINQQNIVGIEQFAYSDGVVFANGNIELDVTRRISTLNLPSLFCLKSGKGTISAPISSGSCLSVLFVLLYYCSVSVVVCYMKSPSFHQVISAFIIMVRWPVVIRIEELYGDQARHPWAF